MIVGIWTSLKTYIPLHRGSRTHQRIFSWWIRQRDSTGKVATVYILYVGHGWPRGYVGGYMETAPLTFGMLRPRGAIGRHTLNSLVRFLLGDSLRNVARSSAG